MPRRTSQNSAEGSSLSRRTSARIAAIQSASPAAKSPVKSPRKRKSGGGKATTDDTESQASVAKSEGNTDELNGMESESSTRDQSVSDIQEQPPKKKRTSESISSVPSSEAEPVTVPANNNSNEFVVEAKPDNSDAEFEVIEKDAVPPPDSVEVAEAIAAQGEDGQLLVGFTQVDKEELPSALSLQVKDVVAETEVQVVHADSEKNDSDKPTSETVNGGDVEHEKHPQENAATDAPVEKLAAVESPTPSAPASGDVAMECSVAEPISQ